MKAASTKKSSNSSSKPTTRSTWDELANIYDQELMENYSIEMKKDSNETISDSEEENNAVKREVMLSSNHHHFNSNYSIEHGRWTKVEHQRFLEGLLLYTNDWKTIHKHIGTRSPTQARSHAQKFFLKIRRAIRDPTDQVSTKETIHQIFHTQMKEENKSLADQQSSLDKITNLILAEESYSKKKLIQAMKITIPLPYLNQRENRIEHNKGQKKRAKEDYQFKDFKINAPFGNENEQKSREKQGNYFHISKAPRKKSLSIGNSNQYIDEQSKAISVVNYSSHSNELTRYENASSSQHLPSNYYSFEFNFISEEGNEKLLPKSDPFILEFEGAFTENWNLNELDSSENKYPPFNFFN